MKKPRKVPKVHNRTRKTVAFTLGPADLERLSELGKRRQLSRSALVSQLAIEELGRLAVYDTGRPLDANGGRMGHSAAPPSSTPLRVCQRRGCGRRMPPGWKWMSCESCLAEARAAELGTTKLLPAKRPTGRRKGNVCTGCGAKGTDNCADTCPTLKGRA